MGGVQRYVLGVLRSPYATHFSHTVAFLDESKNDLRGQFEDFGAEVRPAGLPGYVAPRLFSYRLSRVLRSMIQCRISYAAAKLARSSRASIVHTHVPLRPDLQSQGFLLRGQVAWAWTIHGEILPPEPQLSTWRTAFARRGHPRCAISCVSRAIRAKAARVNLCGEQSLEIVPGGVNVSRIQQLSKRQEEEAFKLPRKGEECVFCSVGRLVVEKGFEVLIKSTAQLRNAGLPVRVFLIGDGPLRARLERLVKEVQLHEVFHFLGNRAEPFPLMANCDVFVLPSLHEGFGIALLEALAVGLPCISTASGGPSEILGESGGILVTPGSVSELAAAMVKMTSPEVRSRFRTQAARLAGRFSTDECAERVYSMYSRICPTAARVTEQ